MLSVLPTDQPIALPIGHRNNTLFMGIAGYRFIDFPRLGTPLLAVTFATALARIAVFWL